MTDEHYMPKSPIDICMHNRVNILLHNNFSSRRKFNNIEHRKNSPTLLPLLLHPTVSCPLEHGKHGARQQSAPRLPNWPYEMLVRLTERKPILNEFLRLIVSIPATMVFDWFRGHIIFGTHKEKYVWNHKLTLRDKFFKWIGLSITSSRGVGTLSQKILSMSGKLWILQTDDCTKKIMLQSNSETEWKYTKIKHCQNPDLTNKRIQPQEVDLDIQNIIT